MWFVSASGDEEDNNFSIYEVGPNNKDFPSNLSLMFQIFMIDIVLGR
jgi:hypothetical protein